LLPCAAPWRPRPPRPRYAVTVWLGCATLAPSGSATPHHHGPGVP
jgi:hypothetical protein